MGEVSPGHRAAPGMTGRSAFRAQIASEIQRLLDDQGFRRIGELTGHSASTAHRRGADLNQWSFAEVMEMAAADAGIAEAIAAELEGAAPQPGTVLTIVGDLAADLTDGAGVTQKIAHAIKDSRVTREEALAIEAALDLQDKHRADLRANLTAIINNRVRA